VSPELEAEWNNQSYYVSQNFLSSFSIQEVTNRHFIKFSSISFSYPIAAVMESLRTQTQTQPQIAKVMFHFRSNLYDIVVAFSSLFKTSTFSRLGWTTEDDCEYVAKDGTCIEDHKVASHFSRVKLSPSIARIPSPFIFCNREVFERTRDHDFLIESIDIPPNSTDYSMILAFKRPETAMITADSFMVTHSATSFPSLSIQHLECKAKPKTIVIDGLNVGYCGVGASKKWSASRITRTVNFWLKLGHKTRVLLASKPSKLLIEPELLAQLAKKELLAFTPTGEYDDSYVITYALSANGYIVSNDRFRDFEKNTKLERQTINQFNEFLGGHRIGFTFLDDFHPKPEFRFSDP